MEIPFQILFQDHQEFLRGVKGQADTADALIRLALRHMAQMG